MIPGMVTMASKARGFDGSGLTTVFSSGGGNSLTFPHDPVILGTPSWTNVSNFDCTTFPTKVNEPGGPTDEWTIDTEFGDPTTTNPAQMSIVADAASPTGLNVWKYFAKSSAVSCGDGVGAGWWIFSTPPRKVYFSGHYKLSNPTAANMDNWHAMFLYFGNGGDIVLDLGTDGGFELFSDFFSASTYFSQGDWFQCELLADAVASRCSMWCNNITTGVNTLVFDNKAVTFSGTTFDHLQADSTVHCASGADPNTDSSLYCAHLRVSVLI